MLPLHVVRSLGLGLDAYLRSKLPGLIKDINIVGDARRWEPYVNNAVLVVALARATPTDFDALGTVLAEVDLLQHDESSRCYDGFIAWKGHQVRVSVYAASGVIWQPNCWWLTGSDHHRKYVQEHARSCGYLLQVNGLFKTWNQRVFVTREEDIYQTLDLPHYPPEVRSNGKPPPPHLVETAVCDSTRTHDLETAVGYANQRGIRELRIRHRYCTLDTAVSFIGQVQRLALSQQGIVRVKPEIEVPVDVVGCVPPLPDDGAYRLALTLTHRPEYLTDQRLRTAIENNPRARVITNGPRIGREIYKLLTSRGIALDIPCHPAMGYEEDVLRPAVGAGVPVTLSTDTVHAHHVGKMTYGLKRARRLRAVQRQVL